MTVKSNPQLLLTYSTKRFKLVTWFARCHTTMYINPSQDKVEVSVDTHAQTPLEVGDSSTTKVDFAVKERLAAAYHAKEVHDKTYVRMGGKGSIFRRRKRKQRKGNKLKKRYQTAGIAFEHYVSTRQTSKILLELKSSESHFESHKDSEMWFSKIKNIKEKVDTASDFLEAIEKTMLKIKEVVQIDATNLNESFLKRIEHLFFFLYHVSSAKGMSDVVVAALQYIQTWTKRSLTSELVELVNQVATERSDGTKIADDWELPEVKDSEMFNIRESWKRMTKGECGDRIRGIINLLIVFGLAPENTEFSMTKELYKVFQVKSRKFNQESILDHLIDGMDFMVGNVVPALLAQDFSLMMTRSDMREVDDEYRKMLNMVDMYTKGMHDELKSLHGLEDEAQLVMELEKVISMHELLRNHSDLSVRREIQTRLIKLDKLVTEMSSCWHKTSQRFKPYAVLIRGGSGVGKSTLAALINHVACEACGWSQGPQYTVVLNGDDKYQSEFRTHHVCVIFDDMGNSKPERAEGNPIFILIQFINNMHCSALSPEADKKGKMDIRCRLVIVTTNTRELWARYFSVSKTSIMRRFALLVTARLADGCAKEDGTPAERFRKYSMPDMWELEVRYPVIKRKTTFEDHLEEHTFPQLGEVCRLSQFVPFLAKHVKEYERKEEMTVRTSEDMFAQEHCRTHPHFTLPCALCDRCEVHSFWDAKDSEMDYSELGDKDPETLESSRIPIFTSFSTRWLTFVDYASGLYNTSNMDSISLEERSKFLGSRSESYPDALFEHLPQMEFTTSKDAMRSIARSENGSLHALTLAKWEQLSDETKLMLKVIAALSLCVALTSLFRSTPKESEQSALEMVQTHASSPKQMAECDDRYKKIYKHVTSLPKASMSASLSDFTSRVDKNLRVASVWEHNPLTGEDIVFKGRLCTFPLKRTYHVFPNHTFEKGKTYRVEIQKKSRNVLGAYCASVLVDESCLTRIPGNDVALAYLPRMGSQYDFHRFLQKKGDQIVKPGDTVLLYHRHAGTVLDEEADSVAFEPSDFVQTAKVTRVGYDLSTKHPGRFPAIEYETLSFNGLCGAMVTTSGSNPVLLGLHVAGDKKRLGSCALLDQSYYDYTQIKRTPFEERINICSEREFEPVGLGHDFEMSDVIPLRNPVNWMPAGGTNSCDIIGGHTKPRARFKSQVVKSPIADQLVEKLGIELKHAAPKAKDANKARRKDLMERTMEVPSLNPTILGMASLDYKMKLDEFFRSSDFLSYVHAISLEDAINGVPDVKGFDPINPMSSLGFPLNMAKWKAFVQCQLAKDLGLDTIKWVEEIVTESGKKCYKYTIEFDKEIFDVETCVGGILHFWSKGDRSNTLLSIHLKDEIRTTEQVEAGKIRCFAGAQADVVIATRMITLPLITAMTYYPTVFESYVGVDAAGRDWQYLYEDLSKFGLDRIFVGDHKGYDRVQRPEAQLEAYGIIKWILNRAGMPCELVDLVDGIATEFTYPFYQAEGAIFRVYGSNPSGHSLTVVLNGLVNILYMRYAYYMEYAQRHPEEPLESFCPTRKRIPLFHENVALGTYGDDNCAGVSPACDWFNFRIVQKQLASVGLTYTVADKSDRCPDFETEDNISMLKRGFKYHPVLKRVVGPIELDSINKSLTYSLKPRAGSDYVKDIQQNLNQQLAACYLHGPKTFSKYRKAFSELEMERDGVSLEKDELITEEVCIKQFESTRCIYEEMLANTSYSPRSNETVLHMPRPKDSEMDNVNHRGAGVPKPTPVVSEPGKLERCINITGNNVQRSQRSGTKSNNETPCAEPLSLTEVDADASHLSWEAINLSNPFDLTTCGWCSGKLRHYEMYFCHECLSDSVEPHTYPKARFAKDSEIGTEQQPASDTIEQVVEFEDGNEGAEVGLGQTMDPTRYATENGDQTFAEYLARPVELIQFSWPVTQPIEQSFNPWDLWAAKSQIANKLNNFRNFKGVMHLKVLINGNKFYWGRALMSYKPKLNAPSNAGNTFHLMPSPPNFMGLTPASQRLHLWIDPSTSSGGTMILPFLHQYDSLDLMAGGEFADMGEINISSIRPLYNTNSTLPVSVTIYGWMEGVSLSGPTLFNNASIAAFYADLETQAVKKFQATNPAPAPKDSEMDEYGDGPLSRPANIVASAAGTLSKIPAISPMMMATQKAASAAGKALSNWGFSRPRVITDSAPMKIWQTGNLANTDAGDISNSLALTSKTEVTVDPRTVGLKDVDELNIEKLCNTESWLTTFDWTGSRDDGEVLFSTAVTPNLWGNATSTLPPSDPAVMLSPMGYVAMLFRYWRGIVKYRFQIVGSGFHKGRLLFVWDCYSGSGRNEPGVTYSKIVDIADTRDFCVEIGWGVNRAGLRTTTPLPTSLRWSTTGPLGANQSNDNGILTVYVLNSLVAPGDGTDPVSVNVIISGKDMKFWAPTSRTMGSYVPNLVPPAGTMTQDQASAILNSGKNIQMKESEMDIVGDATDYVEPEATVCHTFGNTNLQNVMPIIAGEDIPSLRTLLKRYTHKRSWSEMITFTGADLLALHRIGHGASSQFRGPTTGGFDGDANIISMTMRAYVEMCFVGYRGAIRYRFVPAASVTDTTRAEVQLIKAEASRSGTDATIVNGSGVDFSSSPSLTLTGMAENQSFTGMYRTLPVQGGVVDVEIPYYSTQRYRPISATNIVFITDNIQLRAYYRGQPGIVFDSHFDEYESIGEDYNVFFFLGVPPLWRWLSIDGLPS